MVKARFDKMDLETLLVRVKKVRSHNSFGVIFAAEEINAVGVPLDPTGNLAVRIRRCDLAADVYEGQWWEVKGVMRELQRPEWDGTTTLENELQVESNCARMCKPQGEYIIHYLSAHPEIRGLSDVKATNLWSRFGESLFTILDEGDADRLCEVVSPLIAERIVDTWAAEGIGRELQRLQTYNIPLGIGKKALAHYGADLFKKLEEDPYRLIPFSAKWTSVDNLAFEHFSVQYDDPRRLKAAVHEACHRAFDHGGHTYLRRGKLMSQLSRLLSSRGPFTNQLAERAIELCKDAGKIVFDSSGNVYTLGQCALENNVVDAIKHRVNLTSPSIDLDGVIRDYENEEGHGFKLNAEQVSGVKMIAKEGFSILTGGAGCGKTTVLKCVSRVLEAQGYQIVQVALAGKAAKRMADSTGRDASTIASFVGKEYKAKREAEENRTPDLIPRKNLAVVIDEASMLDLLSFNRLLGVLPPSCKIVLVGDPAQLPPVGPGLILHCLVESKLLPHTHLLTAKRFGAEIAEFANSVRQGILPESFGDSVRHIEANYMEVVGLATDLFMENPDESVVICSLREDVKRVNLAIQSRYSVGRRFLTVYNRDEEQIEGCGLYVRNFVKVNAEFCVA